MKLVEVVSGQRFTVWCERAEQGAIPFLQFLNLLQSECPQDHGVLLRRIRQMASRGSAGPLTVCHDICKDPHIWQWTAGGVRVLWFYDQGSCVIVSHGFAKKRGKTPSGERERAVRFFKEYQAAKDNGTITREGRKTT